MFSHEKTIDSSLKAAHSVFMYFSYNFCYKQNNSLYSTHQLVLQMEVVFSVAHQINFCTYILQIFLNVLMKSYSKYRLQHPLRNCIMTNVMHKFLIRLLIYPCFTCFGLTLAHLQKEVYSFGSVSSLLGMVSAPRQ
jgi:hypothetical protein